MAEAADHWTRIAFGATVPRFGVTAGPNDSCLLLFPVPVAAAQDIVHFPGLQVIVIAIRYTVVDHSQGAPVTVR
ncbi:MAG: hypothetical protein WB586_15725 [Chthoniobacterales bacterium]